VARVEGKGMGSLSHCEIGAIGFAIISFFGAIFSGFSLLPSVGIAVGVAVVLALICPKPSH